MVCLCLDVVRREDEGEGAARAGGGGCEGAEEDIMVVAGNKWINGYLRGQQQGHGGAPTRPSPVRAGCVRALVPGAHPTSDGKCG